MRSYKELMQELQANNIQGLFGEVYDYETWPLEDDFDKFYNFCQEYLDRDDLTYLPKPSRIFFNTNTDFNACAYTKKGYHLVEIYKGSIFSLHKLFHDKADRFNSEPLIKYQNLCKEKGVTAEYVLFQFVTLFFLYHETGHLIQQGTTDVQNLEFMGVECTNDQVEEKHARELDADWFGANQLGPHVVSFVSDNDSESLEQFAALTLAGIFIFFVDRSEGLPDIYYDKKCHPHPSVRLTYMLIFLLDVIKANTQLIFNQETVLRDAVIIAQALMKDNGRDIIEEYSMRIFEESDAIEGYVNAILGNREKYPYMCHFKLK